jgi:ribosomal protein L21
MYAVIKTGGKQYRVATGEKIKVEQIAAEVGQEIVIDQVLAVGNGSDLKIGTPLVVARRSASLRCVAVSTTRSAKAIVKITQSWLSAPSLLKELIHHGTEKRRRLNAQRT